MPLFLAAAAAVGFANPVHAQAIPPSEAAQLGDSTLFIDPFGDSPETVQVFDNFTTPPEGPFVLDPAGGPTFSFSAQNFAINPNGSPVLSVVGETDPQGNPVAVAGPDSTLTVTTTGNLYSPDTLTSFSVTVPIAVSAESTQVAVQFQTLGAPLDLSTATVNGGAAFDSVVTLFEDASSVFDPFGGFAPPALDDAVFGIAAGVASGFNTFTPVSVVEAAIDGALAGAGFLGDVTLDTVPGPAPGAPGSFVVTDASFVSFLSLLEVQLAEFVVGPGVDEVVINFSASDANLSLQSVRVDTLVPEPTAALTLLAVGAAAGARRGRREGRTHGR
ncbi:MAG: hypothetical protein AAFX76_10755 [Planctomycetota bacterium]